MVVTDPADRKVSAARQTAFVRVLQNAGRAVEHYLVHAVDENRHGVVAYSRVAMLGCLSNASAEDVAQQVDRLVQLRLNAARPKSEKRGDAARESVPPLNRASASQRLTTERPTRR
jgi:hypothetical protein